MFFALNLKSPVKKTLRVFRGTPEEEKVLDLIRAGISAQEEVAMAAKLDGPAINTILTVLEIGGFIKPRGGGNWTST